MVVSFWVSVTPSVKKQFSHPQKHLVVGAALIRSPPAERSDSPRRVFEYGKSAQYRSDAIHSKSVKFGKGSQKGKIRLSHRNLTTALLALGDLLAWDWADEDLIIKSRRC